MPNILAGGAILDTFRHNRNLMRNVIRQHEQIHITLTYRTAKRQRIGALLYDALSAFVAHFKVVAGIEEIRPKPKYI